MAAPHVLLVEDSGFMSSRVHDALSSEHDFSVSVAGTAAEAREALADGGIDCVLVNHTLPDESGLDVAASTDADVPVILFTTKPTEPLAAEAIDAGVTEFVKKDAHAVGSMDVLANRIHASIRAAENDR